MAASVSDDQLPAFLKSGVYRFADANASFIDPVRILNRSQTRFRVSTPAYYSRLFPSPNSSAENHHNSTIDASKSSKKRSRRCKERKKKPPQALNPREQMADRRHRAARPALLKAHEALLGASHLLEALRNLRIGGGERMCGGGERMIDFVELGSVWQAPLYEIELKLHENAVVPVFDNLVANEASNEIEAELLNRKYIFPGKSSFYMSDLKHVHRLIPNESDLGFNLIVIDPPWENSSAHQKRKYQTLPNRYFLSLPIEQLTHSDGALVALWVTNREKLRNFVENELFPKWGVKQAATFYWLKVKADGSLIGELDLFHHRPYECLILGFSHGKEMTNEQLMKLKHVPDNQVFVSVPGDYSRKPPIGELLMEYVPGLKPARCIELFSREMIAGWTSWGNEPLHFQDSRYFVETTDK